MEATTYQKTSDEMPVPIRCTIKVNKGQMKVNDFKHNHLYYASNANECVFIIHSCCIIISMIINIYIYKNDYLDWNH